MLLLDISATLCYSACMLILLVSLCWLCVSLFFLSAIAAIITDTKLYRTLFNGKELGLLKTTAIGISLGIILPGILIITHMFC